MAANQSGSALRLMLTGGGTGGHLFPAVATAQQLFERYPDSSVLFVGTRRKLDKRQLERYGFTVATVHSYGLKGKRWGDLIKALLVLPFTLCEAIFLIVRFRPDVVLGVGGYVTGPVVAAAWLMRITTVIHEQNSVPGLANRKLGRIVDRICLSLPDSQSYFAAEKTILTGNPVRGRILEVKDKPIADNGQMTVLILGGSQGARAINETVVAMVTADDFDAATISIIHQTGSADEQRVKEAYQKHQISARVSAFFEDMAEVYGKADLVVSRAGATTLAELAVLGKPAILIPYPYAADDHQHKNARRFVDQGGAILFSQEELTAHTLALEIRRLCADRSNLERMSRSMKKLSIPDAADKIVDICMKMARN